ncbi:MAG: replicative DNA helicase [Rickettsiales endosymbiont of Dermacentor nuttalli]
MPNTKTNLLTKINNDNTTLAVPYRLVPYNTLAEQTLLGAILINNELILRVNDFLTSEHFYEPIHQKIYNAINTFIERGIIATPVTLKNYFDKDETLKELGGADYLAQIAGLAATIIDIFDYGHMIYDLSLRRKLINVGQDIVNHAYDDEIELTASGQIERAEQELFSLANDNNSGSFGFKSLKVSILDAINRAEIAFKHKERVTGISTGFIDLDKILGGLQNSDLLILAGRPSMGKTALAVNLALNACKYLYNSYQNRSTKDNVVEELPPSVGFFSLEMSSEQLAARMLTMATGINSSSLRSGQISEQDFTNLITASRELHQLPFFIDDTPAITISALRTRARRLKRKHNLSVLFVDYLQLIRGVSKNSEANRVLEISEITQGLKAIAKELNIPIIALSQLSRAVEQREDKRPLLSDLRESGSIEQDADIVMFIYREEYYVGRREPKIGTEEHSKWQDEMDQIANLTEIIIAKQRNGPIGNVKLHFKSNTTKFDNHAETI